MKLTFQEFLEKYYKSNTNCNPIIVECGWIHQVEKAIKSGQNVSDRVLNCHPEIYFDQTGFAHYRNKIKGLK